MLLHGAPPGGAAHPRRVRRHQRRARDRARGLLADGRVVPAADGPGSCRRPVHLSATDRPEGQGMRTVDRMPLAADPKCVRYGLRMPGRIGAFYC